MAANPEFSIIPQHPAEVAKAIAYVGLTALSLIVAAQQSSASHTVNLADGIAIAIQVVALLGVWFFAGTIVKTVIAAVSAAGAVLSHLFIGGYHPLTLADYLSVGLAVSAALGVAIIPNKPQGAVDAPAPSGPVLSDLAASILDNATKPTV